GARRSGGGEGERVGDGGRGQGQEVEVGTGDRGRVEVRDVRAVEVDDVARRRDGVVQGVVVHRSAEEGAVVLGTVEPQGLHRRRLRAEYARRRATHRVVGRRGLLDAVAVHRDVLRLAVVDHDDVRPRVRREERGPGRPDGDLVGLAACGA